MEEEVRADSRPINFLATGKEEILQNVYTILTTPRGSVPLDREFGIDTSILDDPTPVAKARATAEIFEKVNKYEPRVSITKVSFTEKEDGVLIPVVKLAVKEG
nr:GPW/gp25 family protein [Brevibacillus laterosporus]